MECFSLNLWKRITWYFNGKNNRRPRFPKKAIAAFLAPAKLCLQMSFLFFKVPVSAIWWSFSNMVCPIVLQFTSHLFKPKLPNSRRACKDREPLVFRTHGHPYIGHCWRIVLCIYLSLASFSSHPIATQIPHILAHSPLWRQIFSALQEPSHWPQEARHFQRKVMQPGKDNRGPNKWRMHLMLLNSKETGLKFISVW